jgi:ubiquinone/menaquinone biosynthesis C-methylase UbiE
MKEYYERYWENGVKGKVMNEPPDDLKTERWKKLFNVVKRYLKGKCLDAGSGSGFITSELNKVTPTTGMEISDAALKKARKEHANIKFVKGSVANIPFKNNEFGCIFASELIEHVLDTESMFSEFNRVMKKRGYLIITTPELTWLKRVFIAIFYWDYYYPLNPHIRFYSKNTLKEVLDSFGFKVIHYEHDGEIFYGVPKGMIMVAKKISEVKVLKEDGRK